MTKQQAVTGKYVITRTDPNTLRSVPIPGKSFDDLGVAAAEAARLNDGVRYASQFLTVDLASVFIARR